MLTEVNIKDITTFNGNRGIFFDEDFELLNELVEALSLTENVIKKGFYPIKLNSNTRQNERHLGQQS